MTESKKTVVWLAMVALASGLSSSAATGAEPNGWKGEAAGKYLDSRCTAWFEFTSADRGEGQTQTSCVCCHTVVPYALARPVLRRIVGSSAPTQQEEKLLSQTKRRVDAWDSLDTPAFGLLYDFNEQKKKESRGTEAVLNAVMLAFDDKYAGRTSPGDVTRKVFTILWQTQVSDGVQKGSWEWLDFKLEPWESKNARYFGAALAAIAVGTAPGYFARGADAAVDGKVDLLLGFLKQGAVGQSLYNRTWALWAASALDGTLTADERKVIITQLFAKQREDGGWSLSSLGDFTRSDGTPQETSSDGYATGLVLHVLQVAGVPKDEPKVAKGLACLKANQAESGEWRAPSVNKKRNPATHVGKFMADAATAYAILALSHSPVRSKEKCRDGQRATCRSRVDLPEKGLVLTGWIGGRSRPTFWRPAPIAAHGGRRALRRGAGVRA